MNEPNSSREMEAGLAACIGIDWADEEHVYCLINLETGEKEQDKIVQQPKQLKEWVNNLRSRFGGRKIAVGVEQKHGALINVLMSCDFLVLYPINPSTLSTFRKAFYPSGAKNDPNDAELLAEILEVHRDKVKRWVPDDEQTRLLDMLEQHRRQLVDDQTALTNSLTTLLKAYFPQALCLVGKINSLQACDFLTRWPTLQSVKKVRRSSLENFYKKHGVRRSDVIQRRVKEIRGAVPLVDDQAVIEGSIMLMRAKVAQLRCLIASIQEYDHKIEELFNQHPDHDIFASLPAAGPVMAPRLLTAFGTDRDRYQSPGDIQRLSGVAPVTKQSGKSRIVQKRLACPKFLLQTFVEYADHSRKKSRWAQIYYKKQRAMGKNHQAAIRGLAFKWIRIIYRCWKDRTNYIEEFYQAVLVKKQSPFAPVTFDRPKQTMAA